MLEFQIATSPSIAGYRSFNCDEAFLPNAAAGSRVAESLPPLRKIERTSVRPAREIKPIPIRVLLVDAEKGVTGVLLLDGANPTTSVRPTTQEEASVRHSMERRASARKATDISD